MNPIVNNFAPVRLLTNCISKFHYSGYAMQISVNYFAGLRRRSKGRSPAEIVGSNPAGAWTSVFCECSVFSGRGLCDGLITRPEECVTYRHRERGGHSPRWAAVPQE